MWKVLRVVVLLAVIGGVGVFAYEQAHTYFTPPCSEPLSYVASGYDTRFGISQAEFEKALADAAALWNEAAGETLIVAGTEGVPVSLVYGEVQQTSELGEVIDTEQNAYNAKRAQVEALKRDFTAAKRKYELLAEEYQTAKDEYESEVAYWNARGGAPQKEYEALQKEAARLEEKQQTLNVQVGVINALAGQINEQVDALNAIAKELNKKVNTFNTHADTEYDQGKYESDEEGERISIYEFTDTLELRRVLAHELGHALGLGHTDNPDSIMYSYNIGTTFALSPEDIAELKRVCRLD